MGARDRTYKDFGDALLELKEKNYNISFGRIAGKTGLLEATVTALANRRRANPPSDEVMIKIAECFNVRPEYFYEWRLKRFLELLDSNREILDQVEKITKGYKAIVKDENKYIESDEKKSGAN